MIVHATTLYHYNHHRVAFVHCPGPCKAALDEMSEEIGGYNVYNICEQLRRCCYSFQLLSCTHVANLSLSWQIILF
eukprot:COSAG06_NODE_5824_length_3256_cov_2.551156_1_plen_76_part_00